MVTMATLTRDSMRLLGLLLSWGSRGAAEANAVDSPRQAPVTWVGVHRLKGGFDQLQKDLFENRLLWAVTSVSLLAVALVVLVQLTRFCSQQLRMYLLSRHIPGPSPTWPLLGNFLQLAAVPREDLMDCFMDWRERFGPTGRVWVGPVLTIICGEPEDLRVVFSHQHLQNKSFLYEVVTSFLGNGLITLNSAAHRQHRKAISPSLHLDILNGCIPAIGKNGRHLAEALESYSLSGEVFNAVTLVQRVVSQSVWETVLGSSDLFATREEVDALGEAATKFCDLAVHVGLRPWFSYSDTCFRLLAPARFRQRQFCTDTLNRLVTRALASKEKHLSQDKMQEGRAAGSGLLGHFLSSKEAALMSREELVTDFVHLLAAGIGTSADLLYLLMLALALEPDVQDKVHQELDEVFADDPSRPVTAADLARLRYLEMAMKEVMRYFPLVPLFGRKVVDDVTLPSGTVLPRGCIVAIFPKAVHWDPRWYPNPSSFDPDRFRPEVADTRPAFSYIPFSAGVRGCIGQRSAMISSKTLAATFLREYRFLPAPGGVKRLQDLKLVLGVAMHVKGGIHVRVERRQPPG